MMKFKKILMLTSTIMTAGLIAMEYSGSTNGSGTHPGYGSTGGNEYSGSTGGPGTHPGYGSSGGNQYSGSVQQNGMCTGYYRSPNPTYNTPANQRTLLDLVYRASNENFPNPQDIAEIKRLIESGVDVNGTFDNYGNSLLSLAVKGNRNKTIIKLLVSYGAGATGPYGAPVE